MARPMKNGLTYFPFDVDFFTDKKIKRLRAKYGADGIAVYMYLLCEIYRSGYYIEYDEDLILDISDELNLSEGSTTQIMNYLLSRSLFDETLAKSVKVLTAASIQRRYQEAKKGSKRDIVVERDYWLLQKNETNSFIKLYPLEDNSENNSDNSEKNIFKPENYSQSKVKESKVKESKVKCVEGDALTYGTHNNIHLTAEQYDELCRDYGKAVIDDYIERCGDYVVNSGKKPYSNHYRTLLNWLTKDGVQKQEQHSYDINKILEFSKANIPMRKENVK